jgi:hypothetical protein
MASLLGKLEFRQRGNKKKQKKTKKTKPTKRSRGDIRTDIVLRVEGISE